LQTLHDSDMDYKALATYLVGLKRQVVEDMSRTYDD
jgi:hypothetical protein